MSHYRSNLRDIEFNLFEVFDRQAVLGSGPYEEMDAETARGVLAEIDRLAREDLAASFEEADRHPPVLDPATGTVTLPAALRASLDTVYNGEWFRLDLPAELGGFGAPRSLRWAAGELMLGANPAAFLYLGGAGFAHMLHVNGTPEQQVLARRMIDRHWGATMVLTEPDAGSDVGAGRTKAIQQPDGTWHIEGVKRFITSGDSDWAENIVHFVLARPEGHGPGTKGLSLFIVPKFHVEPDGTLGERNGAYVTNLEKKMGIKGSATCEVTFGAKQPAVGTLLGGVHDGIAQMFLIIETARMLVGTKAMATLSTGYLNALEYAKSRVQGADLTQMTDKTAPRVSILHHPDVRRSLMLQKAYAEGLRALVLYTASFQDAVELAEAAGERDELSERVNDLLLPVVKGFGSERSYELLSSSLQILGGSGYLQDYPIEQYIRDAKIDTLYEGTTAIQGMDLFFRKIVRDQGKALAYVANEVQTFAKGDAGNGALAAERELLGAALEDVQGIVATCVGFLMSAQDDPKNLYKVGLNTTRLTMAVGDLLVGWLLLRQADVALAALDRQPSAKDEAFYRGKVAVAQWFARNVLPALAAQRSLAESTDLDIMELDEAAL